MAISTTKWTTRKNRAVVFLPHLLSFSGSPWTVQSIPDSFAHSQLPLFFPSIYCSGYSVPFTHLPRILHLRSCLSFSTQLSPNSLSSPKPPVFPKGDLSSHLGSIVPALPSCHLDSPFCVDTSVCLTRLGGLKVKMHLVQPAGGLVQS